MKLIKKLETWNLTLEFKIAVHFTASKSIIDPNWLQKPLNSDKAVMMTRAQELQPNSANPLEWLAHPKTIFVVSYHKDMTKQEKLDKWFVESEIKADLFRPKSWAQLGPPSSSSVHHQSSFTLWGGIEKRRRGEGWRVIIEQWELQGYPVHNYTCETSSWWWTSFDLKDNIQLRTPKVEPLKTTFN